MVKFCILYLKKKDHGCKTVFSKGVWHHAHRREEGKGTAIHAQRIECLENSELLRINDTVQA